MRTPRPPRARAARSRIARGPRQGSSSKQGAAALMALATPGANLPRRSAPRRRYRPPSAAAEAHSRSPGRPPPQPRPREIFQEARPSRRSSAGDRGSWSRERPANERNTMTTAATITRFERAARRILVVDDEHSIVDAVATALRYEGYEVE